MNEFKSLRKNWEFQAVYRNGKSKANRCFVMIVKKNDASSNRIGISVSKKVGNSIVRHRLTRLIRESYRLQEERFRCGLDIIVIARIGAKGKDYKDIVGAMLHLGHLHKIIDEGERIMKKILLTGIRFYQRYLSPIKGGSTCKFYPTCSQYAKEAIEKYGALKGGRLAVWRILRCNPFTRGGYDPVP